MRISDWSSDVCSSDLVDLIGAGDQGRPFRSRPHATNARTAGTRERRGDEGTMQTPARDLDWDVAEAVRKHGLYLKQHSGGQQADLRQKTLRGTMLAAVDLRGSNLRGVNLADAVLTDTDQIGRAQV